MNLVLNGAQAMPSADLCGLRWLRENGGVPLLGDRRRPGCRRNWARRCFEPFVTTKKDGSAGAGADQADHRGARRVDGTTPRPAEPVLDRTSPWLKCWSSTTRESIIWIFRKLVEAWATSSSRPHREKGIEAAGLRQADVVFMDVKLPGMDGLAALVEVRRVAPRAKFIVMTAHGTLDTAVRAMKLGAVEYLSKPVDLDQARAR